MLSDSSSSLSVCPQVTVLLAVTSPASQNSFSLNSPPPVSSPNLRVTDFCILVSAVAEVCLACQP